MSTDASVGELLPPTSGNKRHEQFGSSDDTMLDNSVLFYMC